MKIEYMCACPYCGQMRTFESDYPNLTKDEQTEYVGEHCTCEKAEKQRWRDRTEAAITNLLGEGSKEKGFDYELDEDTIKATRVLIDYIIDGHLDNVTFVEPNGDTVKLRKGTGCVKVGRICKKQVVM